MKTRAEQIKESFLKFHGKNPHVWVLFEGLALRAIERGKTQYSSATIFEVMRWHTDMETVGDDECKLNNNYRALYARMFHDEHPEHGRFFRNRKQVSKEQPARYPDRQFFPGEPDQN